MLVKTLESVLGPKLDIYERNGMTWVPGHGPKYFPRAMRLRDLTDGDIDGCLRRLYRGQEGRQFLATFAKRLDWLKRQYKERTAAHKLGDVIDHTYVPDKLMAALEHDFPLDFRPSAGVSEAKRVANIEKVLWRFVVSSLMRTST